MTNEELHKYANCLSNERLKLTIFPTERCNFRCSYCWENYEQGKMKQSIVEGIKNLLTYRAKKLKLLEIQWFGGEPLLAKDIVFDISEHIQQLKTKYQQLDYYAGMTTNGYLLNIETVKKLYEFGITKYNISLDGTSEFHDKTRKLANGEGTFSTIWNNIIVMKNCNLDFHISFNINFFKNNYLQTVPPLLQLLDETLQGDNRFSLYFKSIQQLGVKNNCKIEKVNQEEENLMIDELSPLVKTLNIIRMNFEDYVCYAAHLNAMLIRANGNVNKCIIALNEDCNNVGKLNEDGTLTIDNQKYLIWSKGFEPLDKLYLSCPYKVIQKNIV
jgi:uncharacterized protein